VNIAFAPGPAKRAEEGIREIRQGLDGWRSDVVERGRADGKKLRSVEQLSCFTYRLQVARYWFFVVDPHFSQRITK
jgi:hypothetical protein